MIEATEHSTQQQTLTETSCGPAPHSAPCTHRTVPQPEDRSFPEQKTPYEQDRNPTWWLRFCQISSYCFYKIFYVIHKQNWKLDKTKTENIKRCYLQINISMGGRYSQKDCCLFSEETCSNTDQCFWNLKVLMNQSPGDIVKIQIPIQ